jgi:hypothetical protein
LTPIPASRSRDRRRSLGGGNGRPAPLLFPLVVSLLLLLGGTAILIDIAPRARDYRLIAGGVDVHGTPVSCTFASTARGDPRAMLRLAYMTPSGRFETEERTAFATCAEALAEPRDHRVLYAPSRPGLAVPLAEAFVLRVRLIATLAGALVIAGAGFWGLANVVQRIRRKR